MKITIFGILLIINALASAQTSESMSLKIYNEIDTLITYQYYFAARDKYHNQYKNLTNLDQLRAGTIIDNVFNRPKDSNQKIERLFNQYNSLLPDSAKYYLLQTRQNNYSKLYEYRSAYDATNEILQKFSKLIKKSDKEDFMNTRKIWKVLSGQPKQEVIIKANTNLKLVKDDVGLSNLQVTHESVSIPFIFDTGANFSTVTETTAHKLKMIIFNSLIDVTSITGVKIKARMGICPEFKLGNILVKNAVFIIFPDKELAIPQNDYQINGILGFPVIEAFKEVQITKSGDFIVPLSRSNHYEQNMAIHSLTPIINIEGESYSFDSGADQTMLYYSYYNKHKREIEDSYKLKTLSFGGAGGMTTKKGFLIKYEAKINDKVIKLDSIMLFKENIKEEDNYLSGNIGQDIIKKFDKMTLNFEDMFIHFD